MKNKPLLAVLTVVAAGVVILALVGPGSADDEPRRGGGTVLAMPTEAVDVVALSTPAQAAIAVSSRLYTTSEAAIVTAARAADRTQALAYARRLGVPLLLDDPATQAELTRLRARTVLSVGDVDPQIMAREATTAEVDRLAADRGKVVAPGRSIVLMASTSRFDVAARTAENAGAQVVATTLADPRRDPTTARALARNPKAPVIALGEPFTDALVYAAAAVRAEATQPGGGYFALDDRQLIGLRPGDRSAADAVELITEATARYARRTGRTTVAALELPVTSSTNPASLDRIVAAARKADLQVLLDLQPGRGTYAQQARRFETLLSARDVGVALDVPEQGAVSADDVARTADYVAGLVDDGPLPQKLFVLHQDEPTRSSLPDARPELAVVVSVDVAGDPATKQAAWAEAHRVVGSSAGFALRLYQDADRPRLTIAQVVDDVSPAPDLVLYD